VSGAVLAAMGGASMIATATPGADTWLFIDLSGLGGGSFYINQTGLTATAAGGVAPYTYAWSILSGSGATLNDAAAQTARCTSSTGATITLSCVVTDHMGATAQTGVCGIS
jgi:hypothetical protein